MEDFELTLFDRIELIKQTNQNFDLEQNAYISFSGGADSTLLHYLVDMALPNNKIPRVYINTGIEYNDIVSFVKDMQSKDERIIIIKPNQPVKQVLEKYGYPFKSKQHSHNLAIYQNSGMTTTVKKYLGIEKGNKIIKCPKSLMYQFTPNFKIKVSDKCCYKMKKEPAKMYEKQSGRNIAILGLRANEGGQRASHKGCVVFDTKDSKKMVKFKPLNPITDEFKEWFLNKYNIKLCKLYYAPYNFTRTGCRLCPFALDILGEKNTLQKLLPHELKSAEYIFKPILDEYQRIGYRLKSEEQMTLDDYLD